MGQIPDTVLVNAGRLLVHRMAVGMSNLDGNDWGTIFAEAIGGDHRSRPLGTADVVWNGCAWSVKTIQHKNPFRAKRVRLITGRNSPAYSLNIENPYRDPEATGRAAIAVWNARVNEALGEHEDLRVVVLIRNWQTREFTIFEEAAQRFVPDDYRWEFNKRGNLEAREKTTGEHCFTWQPHGSQFTVKRDVPGSARHFSIGPNVGIVPVDSVLSYVQYRPDWIDIHG